MTQNPQSFDVLPFGTLFRDYADWTTSIQPFFEYSPFDSADIRKKATSVQFALSRKSLYNLLLEYNNTDYKAVSRNLNILRDDDQSLTVVTGQQLTAFGGPLFTLYKIVTTISASKRYSELLNRPVIPVFWLADEDHDYPEVASIGLPNKGTDWKTYQLSDNQYIGKPVASIPLDGTIETLLTALREDLPQTDFTEELLQLLSKCYHSGLTHGKAFGALVQELFSAYGLVLAGSALPKAKQMLSETIIYLIERTNELHQALEQQSLKLEESYHRQASVSASNWFMLDEDGYRKKLQYDGTLWNMGDVQFTTAQLIDVAMNEPNRLSPNVFLRPILQDALLPNIAYIAGPGEIAYYAQMRQLYAVCDKTMPVIIPRLSATLVEPNIRRFLTELPFALQDYTTRIEDLHQRFVQQEQSLDIQSFANDWITQVETLADSRTSDLESFDPTLVGTLVRIRQEQVNAINTLRQKMIKSEKSRLDVQLKRISKVQLALFPNMNLQERELAFIYPLSKYGRSFIDHLIRVAEKNDGRSHVIIDL